MRFGQWGLASTLIIYGIAALGDFSATAATDECLSGPKGGTPQGKHWYYRIERPSKRHCWYLGDEGRKTSQETASAESSEPPAPEKSVPKRNDEPMQPAVANARAELTNDASVPFTAMPPIASQQTVTPPQTGERSPQPNTWSLAERWLDPQPSGRVAQADTTAPAPAPSVAENAAPVETTPAVQAPSQQTAVVQQTPVPAPTAAASDNTPDMLHMMLGILTAAIALAAIFARLISSHIKPRARPVQRRAIWQSVDDDAERTPAYARARTYDPSIRAQAEEDVEELLRALRYPPAPHATSQAVSAGRAQMPRGRSGARA